MLSRRRCAVLGSPIRHSLSPVLHRAAYDELGLGWRYDAVEVREHELAGFLDSLDESWAGLSLTMPLKRAVLPLLDEASDGVRRAGAANTVVLADGRRCGHQSDVPGAVAALREHDAGPLASALVLGGGATAASVLLALADEGCERAVLAVRDPGRVAGTLAALARHDRPPRVQVHTLADVETGLPDAFDVAVGTVPVAAQSPGLLAAAVRARVVFDVVYDPWPTPLTDAAAAAGRTVVSGLDLLVHQAVLQVELMTGRRPSAGTMRDAGRAALALR